ncbi:MAG: alpha/beta hydrolase fold protein, partial [Conexibacter sp.]|nr:alpha/beta hydrolase fold protein [Conexibacter sp.]
MIPSLPTPDRVAHAAANAFDMVVKGGVADLRRTPARIVDEAPKGTVFQYLAPEERTRHLPVLLIPPLAAPTI